jgi:ParB family chromosome partitioning protein
MTQERIEYIPIGDIEAAAQVRTEFSEESLQGMARSLLEVGQLQPIRVRREGDSFVVVDGERRVRAAKMTGKFTKIAAIIEERPLDAAEIEQRQIIANCQRDDLTPLEKARAIHDLMKLRGWNAGEVAAKLGFTGSMATKLLALVELPESIQALVAGGKIPASAGYELSRLGGDAAEQAALAEQIARGSLTRDGLSAIIKRRGAAPAGEKPATISRLRASLSGGRTVTLAGEGLTNIDALIGWLEELLSKARKLRPRGLELGTFARLLKDEAQAG